MPSLLRTLAGKSLERADSALGFEQWLSYFNYQGHQYPLAGVQQTLQNGREPVGSGFRGYVEGAYKRNGVVFACMLARMLLFSEARFQWQQLSQGRPGNLFGSADLDVLEVPWPGGTTGDLLSRAEQDASLAGNAFFARPFVGGSFLRSDRILRLQPDWVTIVTGSRGFPDAAGVAPDAEVVGYVYEPGGPHSGVDPVMYVREEVAHFAPIPDPEARWRGMSWLTPILREIESDTGMTRHKLKFLENGATPNVIVTLDMKDPDKFAAFVEKFRAKNEGVENAYKTLFFSHGADAKVVGSDLKQLDFKITQGAGETRIAAAAGVPPVIVGLSEGLQAATYSNYGQARRRFADGTMRPLWRNIAGSLQTIMEPPAGSRLWYDDRDIPFLQEDQRDAAEVGQFDATSMKTLVDAGYDPESVVAAVKAHDYALLQHTGLVSVQLQEPGAQPPQRSRERELEAAIAAQHGRLSPWKGLLNA